MLRKPKLIPFAQTQEAFDLQVEEFLVEHDFPVTDSFKALVGSLVQHMPDDADSFDPQHLAKRIRKARVNEYAFYNIHPSKRPKAPSDSQADSSSKEEVGS